MAIESRKMVIYSHNDIDGRCAGAIAGRYAIIKGFVPKYIEAAYKDPVSKFAFDELNLQDWVAIVDFSFKPIVMASLRNFVQEIIWCDHHQSAKDYGYNDLLGVRDFTYKGLSGCECTWKFCFPGCAMPEALKLIGDYDAWRLETKPRCFEFYEGLKLRDHSPQSSIWQALLHFDGTKKERVTKLVQTICDEGKIAIQYRDKYCEDIADIYGYETEIDGHKAFAMNLYRFGSPQFGDKINQYPVCIAYVYDGRQYTISMYSEQMDVSKIATAHGGGGHKEAAGMICQELPFKIKDKRNAN